MARTSSARRVSIVPHETALAALTVRLISWPPQAQRPRRSTWRATLDDEQRASASRPLA
ncbi:hypothetical protein ABZ477_10135 [Microbacterium sp. NPDC019599]|uniref:hypothetical protein n=1 Tax=Microbacterium sp. NPDC019599 TaxID=3154690 RepID=UPI0033CA9C88